MTFDKRTDWQDNATGGTPIMAADMLRIEQGIADTDTGLADAGGRLDSAEGRLTTAEGRLTTAEGRLDADDSTLSGYGTRITSAEGRLGANETAIAGKAAAVHTHAIADLTATGTKDATTFLRGDGTWAAPPSGGAATNPRLGILRVASAEATTAVKAQCDYVCTGTNDHTVINAALLAASRPSDGFGGIGAGCVELVGPNFYVGNDNTSSINMYPATWLRGSGPGTLIQPMYSTYSGIGCIQLVNGTVDHTQLSDFTIGKENSAQSKSHGVMYTTTTVSGSAYSWDTGSDSFHFIHNITILKTAGYGIYANGGREFQVNGVLAWDTALTCFQINASDCKFTACTAQAGSGGPGFAVAGGNTKLTGCKAYFTDGSNDGYLVSSARAEIIGCAAQDNGRWGFNVTSTDVTMSGCVADSNARVDATGGGFLLAGSGNFHGLTAFDRGQTPASPQLQGIVFSGSPQVNVTGRVKVPSGTAQIVGSPGSNSYVRVVRDGTSIYKFGDAMTASSTAPSSPATGDVWVDLSA